MTITRARFACLACAFLLSFYNARAEEQRSARVMAHYLIEAKFTDQSWAAMAQNPQDRSTLLAAVVARLGGKIDAYWLTFGDRDAVVIIELPGNVDAEALQIAGMAGGGFKTLKTTSLLTVAEGMAAMKKAGELRASAEYGKAHDALTH